MIIQKYNSYMLNSYVNAYDEAIILIMYVIINYEYTYNETNIFNQL